MSTTQPITSAALPRGLRVDRYDPNAPKGMQIPLRELAAVLKPPDMLDLAEWAEENVYLSGEGSAQRGKFVAWPFQIEPMRVMSPRHPCEKVALLCGSQIMKCLALDTSILTTKGWKLNGELTTADMVFDENGKPCRVLAVSDVLYGRKCYRIGFDDGEFITCDDEHLWMVYDRLASRGKRKDQKLIAKTTAELYQNYVKVRGDKHEFRYRIPCTKPLELMSTVLPVDPYVLGVWLGDGSSNSACVTVDLRDEVLGELQATGTECAVLSVDSRRPHVAKVGIGPRAIKFEDQQYCTRGHLLTNRNRGKHGCRKCATMHTIACREGRKISPGTPRDTMHHRMAKLGVLNNKHIPLMYFQGSMEQRRALLQGLMDSDGTSGNPGSAALYLTNKRLAVDALELIRGLGMKPSFTESRARLNGQDVGPLYVITFTAYKEDRVFRIPRKQAKLRSAHDPKSRVTESRRRSITSITPVESVPVRCILVDSPSHMFLAGDGLVPTHNTQCLLNMLAYVIAVDPGPVLFVEPRQSDAEALSKDRIAPMIRDTPALQGKVADAKSRDSGNTIEHKKFTGGHLSLATATSPSSLAMRPIRYLFLDEISRDQYRNSSEGDPVKLAEKRTENFPNRKIIYASSPSEDGNCRISDVFSFSDQRQWNVPCPHCGFYQVLEFAGLVWSQQPHEPVEYTDVEGAKRSRIIPIESTEYRCVNCDNLIPEKFKPGMNDKGKYVPTNPNGKYPGFRVNRLVSPITRWGAIAQEWVEAKDRPQLLKVFTNTVLAETYKVAGDSPPWEVVASRREHYPLGSVPSGVRFLTAGIDVQKNWIDLSVWGWGRNRECWLVDKAQIQGRTSDPGVWQELTAWVARSWTHPHGAQMHLARYAIDTGHETNMAYSWVRKQGQVAIAIKGYDNLTGVIVGHPSGVDVHTTGKRVKRGILVWPIDVSKLKQELYGRLNMPRPDGSEFPSGWIHLPQVEDEFCKQLTAEALVERKDRRGYMKREWIKNRERNEALDEWNYARAAAHILGVDRFTEEDWCAIEDMLGAAGPPIPQTVGAGSATSAAVVESTQPPNMKEIEIGEGVELEDVAESESPQVDRESWAGQPVAPNPTNPPAPASSTLSNNRIVPNPIANREPLKRPGGWLGRSAGGWLRR